MAGKKSDRAVADRLAQIDVRALKRAGHIAPGAQELLLRIGGQTVAVKLAHTQCHLGGARVWWRCPCCNRRAALLYPHGKAIACRRCWRLRYLVESMDDNRKAFARADKLRERLGWTPGIVFGEGRRPRGMHRSTFSRLVSRYRAAEAQALGAIERISDRVSDKLGRIHAIQSARRR